MALESQLSIYLENKEGAQEAFEHLLEYIDRENIKLSQPLELDYLELDDEIRYKRRGNRTAGLKSDLIDWNLSAYFIETFDRDPVEMTATADAVTHESGHKALANALEFTTLVYSELTPTYVFGMPSQTRRVVARGDHPQPITDETLAQNRINHPTWLMLFPPEMVETYGREWLLDLPAERIDELDDGAIMIVATTAITECDTDEEIQETVTEAMAPIIEAFEQRMC